MRYNNFGFSIGGPILKKKMFFYFDYDQIVDHGNAPLRIAFQHRCAGGRLSPDMQNIFDPTTQTIAYGCEGNPYPVRQSFASEYGTSETPSPRLCSIR